MDEQSFFGGLLHVCYAPEFETVEETRKKLQERNAYVARTTKNKGMESLLLNTSYVSGILLGLSSWSSQSSEKTDKYRITIFNICKLQGSLQNAV